MLSHVSVGSNDLPKSKAFYEALFAIIGFTKMFDHPSGGAMYGTGGKLQFCVLGPFDGKPATPGNGTMTAFVLQDPATVDSVYAKALSLGGTCEGEPSPRGGGYHAGYFRDLDGNKISIFSITP